MVAQQTLTLLVGVRQSLFRSLNFIEYSVSFYFRSVAQLGRALRSGRRGRKFKSCHSDFFISIPGIFVDKISGIFLLSRRASIFFQKEV